MYRQPGANTGFDQTATGYLTTLLTSSVTFGFPNTVITPGTFRTASNLNPTQLAVSVGDRIGVRVRTLAATDPSAADITQLSFSASLIYN